MSEKINEIIEIISKMNVLEIVELTKAIEKKFDISDIKIEENVTNTNENKNNEKKEKTEYSVVITDFGNNKLNVIKTIRTILNLGLKEAKDFVENLPAVVKENISKDDAENIKNRLEETGAKVELK